MTSKTVFVDVIHNPFCFIEAPEESYKKELEEKWDIIIREFNIWEIEDSELDSLPEHISRTIKEAGDPNNPNERWSGGGSLFFLDGRKLDLSPALKWPQVEAILKKMRREE